MRILFVVGLILLVLGIASLFVPIPQHQQHGITAGNLSIGIETVEKQKVHPAISAVLIAGGVLLLLAGSRRRVS